MVGPPPSSWSVEAERHTAREVARGVWCLRLPLPWDLIPHVNAYALERSDGGFTLVDCGGWGDESSWTALVSALADAGIAISDVRLLVLTHYHSDHAGAAARLVDESGCEVAGHADHAHFTDALLAPRTIGAARRRRALAEGVPPERVRAYATVREEIEGIVAPVVPDRLLGDGDQIGQWSVLRAPGHAPSHVCLHRAEDGTLIAGDLLAATFTPYMDYGYSENPVEEYLHSLSRLEGLPIELVLPGHGRPVTDPSACLQLWREGLEGESDAIVRALGAGPAGGYDIALAAVGETNMKDDRSGPSILSNVLCHLRHLRAAGRVDRVAGAHGRLLYSLSE